MKRLLLLLIIPTFSFFLQPGIHSMHDPHLFRQYEFSKHCMAAWSIPCRWAPDSGFGYGEPLFAFYGQIPYWVGHVFYSLGLSLITSLKAVLILTLILSAMAMYATTRSLWGKSAGFVAAILYTYAPYRAVDVWVRGNLNEAWAFVLLPLLLHFSRTKKWLWFAISLSLLIVTHNLSFVMFAPFLLAWIIFHHRSWRPLFNFVWASLLALVMSSFYLLPVIFESSLVTLHTITEGYFNYQLHFTTLYQLFISRFWGYGASLWGPRDDLSFSIGHLHWGLILVSIPVLYKSKHRNYLIFLIFSILFSLFMTHGKSLFIWQLIPPLAFIQFPWRFLEIACIFTALLGGLVASKLSRYFKSLIIVLALMLSAPYFITNDWRYVTDQQFFSGDNWINQMSTSLKDYWPTAATTFPDKPAPLHVEFATGTGLTLSATKTGHTANYLLTVTSPQALVVFPIVDFPSWQLTLNDQLLVGRPYGPLAQIATTLTSGTHKVHLELIDTPIRTLGNVVSMLTLVVISIFVVHEKTRSHFSS